MKRLESLTTYRQHRRPKECLLMMHMLPLCYFHKSTREPKVTASLASATLKTVNRTSARWFQRLKTEKRRIFSRYPLGAKRARLIYQVRWRATFFLTTATLYRSSIRQVGKQSSLWLNKNYLLQYWSSLWATNISLHRFHQIQTHQQKFALNSKLKSAPSLAGHFTSS